MARAIRSAYSFLGVSVVTGILAAACSGGNDQNATNVETTGGTVSVSTSTTGGRTGTGGAVGAGGTHTGGASATTGGTHAGGGTATGGSSAVTPTGGAPAAGGSGATTGGTTTAGGAATTGGATTAGGAATTGGATTAGGAATTGGTTTAGGAATTGGATTAGGAVTTGGATTAGGAVTTGGATTAGGASSATGGTSAAPGGASAMGGSSAATGGSSAAATGGAPATGGSAATGGVPATGGTTAIGGSAATGGTTAICGLVPATGGGGSSSLPLCTSANFDNPTNNPYYTTSFCVATNPDLTSLNQTVSVSTVNIVASAGGINITGTVPFTGVLIGGAPFTSGTCTPGLNGTESGFTGISMTATNNQTTPTTLQLTIREQVLAPDGTYFVDAEAEISVCGSQGTNPPTATPITIKWSDFAPSCNPDGAALVPLVESISLGFAATGPVDLSLTNLAYTTN